MPRAATLQGGVASHAGILDSEESRSNIASRGALRACRQAKQFPNISASRALNFPPQKSPSSLQRECWQESISRESTLGSMFLSLGTTRILTSTRIRANAIASTARAANKNGGHPQYLIPTLGGHPLFEHQKQKRIRLQYPLVEGRARQPGRDVPGLAPVLPAASVLGSFAIVLGSFARVAATTEQKLSRRCQRAIYSLL